MSMLLFSVYISAATLAATAGYALLMSVLKKEIDQRWVLGELILGIVSSFVLLAITATNEIGQNRSTELFLLAFELLLFAFFIFTFFSIRSPQWSKDERKVAMVRMAGYGIFALSIIVWSAILWLF